MSTVHADLHTHTHCSDGTRAPADLVALAASRGLHVLAITDHDTVAGLAEAQSAAQAHGVHLVTGTELSVTVNEHEVHLLGYGFDPTHDGLTRHLDRFVEARRERVRSIVSRLQDVGLHVEMADVEQVVEATGTDEVPHQHALGRPHVAQALVRGGHVDTVDDAFDRYLSRGQPAFVAKPPVPASDALDLLHDAGGIGVLAHPGHWTPTTRLRALIDVGLDGIEVVHPSHDVTLESYYQRIARSRGLLTSGGSDFHGRGDDDERFGRLGMDREHWLEFADGLAEVPPQL